MIFLILFLHFFNLMFGSACVIRERECRTSPPTTPTHILRNVQHMCFVFETLANSIKHPARGRNTRNKERERT
jgi:hypothetical protein